MNTALELPPAVEEPASHAPPWMSSHLTTSFQRKFSKKASLARTIATSVVFPSAIVKIPETTAFTLLTELRRNWIRERATFTSLTELGRELADGTRTLSYYGLKSGDKIPETIAFSLLTELGRELADGTRTLSYYGLKSSDKIYLNKHSNF